jgi:hypothetical protein
MSQKNWMENWYHACALLGGEDKVIRLFNKDHVHVLSILPCKDDDGIDICTPDGKVYVCGEFFSLIEYLMGFDSAEKYIDSSKKPKDPNEARDEELDYDDRING